MATLIDVDKLLEQMKRRKEYVGRPSDPVCLVEDAPTVKAYNAHEVACIIAELFGDDCACNFNDISDWLPEHCDFTDTCCPNVAGVACWEQYLKHKAEHEDDPSHPFADDVMMG